MIYNRYFLLRRGIVHILTTEEQCIPKRRHNNKFNPHWKTKELLTLCRKKKLLYGKAKRANTVPYWNRYLAMNNSAKKACNAAKRNYTNDLADELAANDNPKPFWNFMKSMRKGSNNLVSLNADGVTISNYQKTRF